MNDVLEDYIIYLNGLEMSIHNQITRLKIIKDSIIKKLEELEAESRIKL